MYVMTELFSDRNVTYPSEILTNYLTQIWNPVRCCTIPVLSSFLLLNMKRLMILK